MSRLEELIQEHCPNGVQLYAISDICRKVVSGGTPKSGQLDYYGGSIPWLRTQEVNWNEIYNTEIKITEKGLSNSSAKWIPKNCVIVAMYGATAGKVAINKIPLTTNQACCNLEIDENKALYRYVFHWLNKEYEALKSLGQGSQSNINAQIIKQYHIPVPPLPVQEEIVRILDSFTQLTAELQAELQARKKQYEYYFKHIFALYDSPMVKLGDIGSVKMCKRILKSQTSSQGEIPFYKIGTFGKAPDAFISREVYNEYCQKYSHPSKGDILISCSGTIGRTVVFDGEPAYFQDSNIVWLEHDGTKVTNDYLRYAYKTNPWIVSTGGTISRLYNDGILKAEIPLPTIEQQKQIVKLLDRFDALCNDLSSGLPAEIQARQKQYEYYRDKLLTFPPLS